MPTYLKIYSGTVTSGQRDGYEVSLNRSMECAITAVLDSSKAEAQYIKCAIRCMDGFKTSGTTTLSFTYYDDTTGTYKVTGGAINRFQIARDNGYTEDNVDSRATWASSLSITDVISNTNILFWVKISTVQGENPVNDTTISLTVNGTIVSTN